MEGSTLVGYFCSVLFPSWVFDDSFGGTDSISFSPSSPAESSSLPGPVDRAWRTLGFGRVYANVSSRGTWWKGTRAAHTVEGPASWARWPVEPAAGPALSILRFQGWVSPSALPAISFMCQGTAALALFQHFEFCCQAASCLHLSLKRCRGPR